MSDQSGYQPMPADQAPYGQPAATPADQPSTVRNSIYLIWTRIVLGVLSIVLALTSRATIKGAVERSNGSRGTPLTPSQVDTAVTVGIVSAVVIGVVFLGLYVLLAIQLGKGKRWAWITTLVLSALGVLSLFGTFAQMGTTLTHSVDIIVGLLDLSILVLLLLRPSRDYFARRTG